MEKYIAYFEKKWDGSKPLVKLFQTEFGDYLYDPGTNKLFRCNPIIHGAIREFQMNAVSVAIGNLTNTFERHSLLEGLQEVVDTIEAESILVADPKKINFDCLHFSRLESEINHNLGQVILEVTEECNL